MAKEKEDKLIRKLEKMVVNQNDDSKTNDFEEVEHKIQEDPKENKEGLGIEEEENAGQEPYKEYEKEQKDPDEPDEDE
jgi:hypothetical protein